MAPAPRPPGAVRKQKNRMLARPSRWKSRYRSSHWHSPPDVVRPALLRSRSIARLLARMTSIGRLARAPLGASRNLAAFLTAPLPSTRMTPVGRPLASRTIQGWFILSRPMASIALLLRNVSARLNCRNTGLSGEYGSSSSRVNGRLVVRELVGRPSAQVVHPLPRPLFLRLGADQLERLFARIDAIEAELEIPVRALLLEVRVVVDETRHDRAAPQVDALGCRSCEPRNVLIGADRDEAVAAHGDCLGDR